MEQFKILTDLRDYIKILENQKGRVLARPIPNGGSPVFYRKIDVKKEPSLFREFKLVTIAFQTA